MMIRPSPRPPISSGSRFGHAGITEMAAAMHTHYPDRNFRRTAAVDAHHRYLRFGWQLVGSDGAVAVAGIDVGGIDVGELAGGR